MKKASIIISILFIVIIGFIVKSTNKPLNINNTKNSANKNNIINISEPIGSSRDLNMVLNNNNAIYIGTMKRDILCLMLAYPKYVTGVERHSNGYVYIIMKSGKRILYDDRKVKTYEEKLNNPDLQDMFSQLYPLYDIKKIESETFDPGRFRVYDLFKEIYGESKKQIESSLTKVKFGSQYLSFNSRNNASSSLEKINTELQLLAKTHKNILSFAYPSSGTFNYRLISGTKRLSEHSYGIAIDLAANRSDYWQWSSRKVGEKRLAVYPQSITKIFEKNNFIWGGKWGFFDIMHYEYRPELILKSKYFSAKPSPDKSWFNGAPYNEVNVRNYINLINKELK